MNGVKAGVVGTMASFPELQVEADECAEAGDQTNKSVIKAMALLTELGWHPAGVTATEMAQKMRMSRPTVFRLLLSLTQTGFVEKTGSKYRLGWKVARLGRRADPYAGLIAQVQPILAELAAELNETINYAVVNGEIAFELIAEASASRLITASVAGYIGMEPPLHASAMGKIMLAHLPDERVRELVPEPLVRLTTKTITDIAALVEHLHVVRARGYAMIDDELEESLFSLAVPVHADSGELIGLLSVTGPSPRLRMRDPAALSARLRDSSHLISSMLSGRS